MVRPPSNLDLYLSYQPEDLVPWQSSLLFPGRVKLDRAVIISDCTAMSRAVIISYSASMSSSDIISVVLHCTERKLGSMWNLIGKIH